MLNWNRSRSFKYSGYTLSVYETQEIDVIYSRTNFIIVELYDDGSAKIAYYDRDTDLYDYDHTQWMCKEDIELYVYETFMGR